MFVVVVVIIVLGLITAIGGKIYVSRMQARARARKLERFDIGMREQAEESSDRLDELYFNNKEKSARRREAVSNVKQALEDGDQIDFNAAQDAIWDTVSDEEDGDDNDEEL